jgi:hypothetical protein
MTPHDQFRHSAWRKSSYSQGATQCVEIADLGAHLAIRDSKNPGGTVLLLTASQIRDLARRVKADQLSL